MTLCSAGKKIGEMVLYFGCRNKDIDFIYREEASLLYLWLFDNSYTGY